MAKSLVIVESPAKARTIGRYLGSGYLVKASMGHVRDLPQKKFGVDVDQDFDPTYAVLPAKKKTVGQLKKAARDAETVYLATDLDREGEAIAWHLCHALDVPEEKAFRVVFNQITRSAVRSAFDDPGHVDLAKVNAQQARRILDRVVGYKLSPLLWRVITKGLSAGRVQSVAVRLVVDREREIAAFKPEEFWKITATLAHQGQADDEGARFTAELIEWQGEKFTCAAGDDATAVVKALTEALYVVQSVQVKDRSEQPPPPFITSTLQQQASNRLHFAARRTMRIAQQLYEGLSVGEEGEVGLITYMRTDSVHIAPEAMTACRDHIGEAFGDDYLPEKPRYFKQRKGAQAAHEAIRPTDVSRTPDAVAPYLDKDQARLYELVWKRFVASQMAAARYQNTTARIAAADGVFQARGRVLLFDGFRKVAGLPKTEDQLLPALSENDPLDLVALDPTQHFTEPPPRYNEASLVRALEREGIGRPSTYAPIVATIHDRGYVKLIKRRFHATDLGMLVTDFLVKHFERIMDVGFTRHMESELDEIEEQGADWVAVLKEFYGPFKEALDAAGGRVKEIKAELSKAEGQTCPECGKDLAYRWSKFGRFLGCTGYPECSYKQAVEGDAEEDEADAIDEACPECGKPLAVRRSKFGKFIGCTGFPECRYKRRMGQSTQPNGDSPANGDGETGEPKTARQQTAEKALEAAEEAVKKKGDGAGAEKAEAETYPPCEQCGAPMVRRNSRRGPFLGCSAYPECRNTRPLGDEEVNAAAEGQTCPECGAPMLVRRSRHGVFLGCSKYPECKGTRSMDGQGGKKKAKRKTAKKKSTKKKAAPKKTGVKCGRKGCDGELLERRSRFGVFYGCSNYPECTYKTNELPDES